MAKYVIERIIQAIVIVLLIASVTFLLMNLVPGGPFLSEKSPSAQVLAALEAKYGLDQPLPVQLKTYLIDFIHGDLGVSFKMQKNRPVLDIITDMFPVSAKIGVFALLWAIIAGIPIGCLAAYHRGKGLDSFLRVLTTLGISMPTFVIATSLMILFGVTWKLLPIVGLSSWMSYLLPCFSLGFYPMCYIARLTRSSMLDVVNQEYIRTARAKGVPPWLIIFKHALRNSLIPVLSYLGPLIAYTLTGGFVVEFVFNIPGLGRYFIQSILNRDYPIIMGTTIFLAALLVFMNLIVDIVYKFVDPRVDLSRRSG
ncbi:MAG TPA: ABC transporter permease [Anaerovoracaceae bacterium]|nr:ABC transporter permease [Anaerovoracaceae bacterium]